MHTRLIAGNVLLGSVKSPTEIALAKAFELSCRDES